MSKINIENLKVEIASKEIVKGISLDASGSEFLGLLGPNGSGKSTLLKAIYRVLKSSGGAIFFEDKDIKDIKSKDIAKSLGVVSQFNDMNFSFKVIDIVLMGRTPHKTLMERDNKEDYKIAIESLKSVGMEEHLERDFSSLSGGEKQRVVLARALTQKPKVLILDEPTNHLDIKYQIEIMELVKHLDICVIAALHDLSIAAKYCDKLVIIKNGEVFMEGKPKEIINSKMIKAVYDIDSHVYNSPITGDISIEYYIKK